MNQIKWEELGISNDFLFGKVKGKQRMEAAVYDFVNA